MNLDQTRVVKAGFRIALSLALSLMLFLPAAYADSTITLTSPNAETRGLFGSSVAINENDPLVVVGAPGETANTFTQAGNAYVLDTATGSITTLTSPNAQMNGEFGSSVSISGTTAVVGAPVETGNTLPEAGNAYVFDASGSLITTLTSPNAQTGGLYSNGFGLSVSISGTTVVVGAPHETENTLPIAGHAYVFDATDGSLITTLTSPNTIAGGNFGHSVSISGTTVVVGAPGETEGTTPTAGHAYVFDATDGSLITTLTSPNAEFRGVFGFSVAVSGTTVVVGAPSENSNTVFHEGHAYVFDASGSLVASLKSPYAQARGIFGYSVSVSCATVVVGAPGETANGQTEAGHAYSFDATTGFLTTTLTSPNALMKGDFGYSVAVSGTTVVVGALYETGGGFTQAGHAYIFP